MALNSGLASSSGVGLGADRRGIDDHLRPIALAQAQLQDSIVPAFVVAPALTNLDLSHESLPELLLESELLLGGLVIEGWTCRSG